jgi:alpha-D-ribose 1-methylphosphonate 5-triphosphate synthase subunit PhnH
METPALEGGFAKAPVEAAEAFRAAMAALARPGRIERLTGGRPPAPLSVAAGTLILTLCDPDTGLHLAPSHDAPEIRAWVAFHTGAPLAARGEAAFAVGTWEALLPLTGYPLGTAEYPDRSATLIVECERLEAAGAKLQGPGIKGQAQLSLPGTGAFAANARLFPLGLDFYFTAGDRVAALPRSTRVST